MPSTLKSELKGCSISCCLFSILSLSAFILIAVLSPPGERPSSPDVLHQHSNFSWGGGMNGCGYSVKILHPATAETFSNPDGSWTEIKNPVAWRDKKKWTVNTWQKAPDLSVEEWKAINHALASCEDNMGYMHNCKKALSQKGTFYALAYKLVGTSLSAVDLVVVDTNGNKIYEIFRA